MSCAKLSTPLDVDEDDVGAVDSAALDTAEELAAPLTVCRFLLGRWTLVCPIDDDCAERLVVTVVVVVDDVVVVLGGGRTTAGA